MVQKVFHRYEKKYFLSAADYQKIRERLMPYMMEDAYGLHTIRNIYFDTKTDELIRNSLKKPPYKEKFRVRCYGEPQRDSQVFLEIKKKYRGIVNKRRIPLAMDEAKAYLIEGVMPKDQSQILREIDYVLKYYSLEPKLYLAYDRIALFGIEDSEFRVTFDTNVRCRNHDLELSNDQDTTFLTEPGCYLMEVKISNAMPMWFVNILTDLEIPGISFSKYGRAYHKNLIQGYYSYLNGVNIKSSPVEESADSGRICIC